MKQVGKRSIPKKKTYKPKTITRKKSKIHNLPGTSKLEERFAVDFLEKLGVKYIYQFKVEEIGRWYDFKIIDGPIIEIQGSYWHGDPRLYEKKDLNKTQLKAQIIDEYKKKWALSHGIPIYYIWEKDINENPDKVMNFLKEILYVKDKKEKNKRHKNRLFL